MKEEDEFMKECLDGPIIERTIVKIDKNTTHYISKCPHCEKDNEWKSNMMGLNFKQCGFCKRGFITKTFICD